MGENEQDAGQYDERGMSYGDYYGDEEAERERARRRRQREIDEQESNLPQDQVPGAPGDYQEGEEEFYDAAELTDEEIEDAFRQYSERVGDARGDLSDDELRGTRSFQNYLDAIAKDKGRRQAGLSSSIARERAAQLSREARGEAGPSFQEQELNRTMQQLRQAQTAMARGRRGRSAAASQLGAQQSRDAMQALATGYVTDLRRAERESARQALDDFLLQRSIAGEQAVAMDMTRQAQQEMAARQRQQQFLQGLLGLAGTLGAAFIVSDEDMKTNKKPVGKAARNMLDKLETKKYDRGSKKGIFGGMAQSLKKSEMGRGMVAESAGGVQMVDVERAIGAMLAANKDMHERIKKLEGSRG